MARVRLLLWLLLCAAALPAFAASLRLTLADLDGPAFSARNIVLELPDGQGPARLAIASLRIGDVERGPVRLSCAGARFSSLRLDCPAGQLEASGQLPLPLSLALDLGDGDFRLTLAPGQGERWLLAGNGRRQEARLELENARLDRLAAWLPAVAAWQPKGTLSGRLDLKGSPGARIIALDARLQGAGLGNSAGTLALEHVGGRLELSAAEDQQGRWNWKLLADWREGEGYFAPIYLPSGGLTLAASGALAGERLTIGPARLEMAGVGGLDFSASAMTNGTVAELTFSGRELALGRAGELLLAPWLEQAGLPKLRLAGALDVAGNWRQGRLTRLDLGLRGGGLEEPEGRFALSGVEARLPWRLDGPSSGEIKVAGGHFQKLPLGAFTLATAMNGLDFRLAKLEIPVLDGVLMLEDAHALKKDGAWQWQLAAALTPVSMELLTRTLGLPLMSGRLSASLPRIHGTQANIALDGMLVIQVFDGFLAVNGLSLTDPFGRAPVLRAANVDIRHLDLGQLTHTFAFGEITGYLDGDIDGLELVHWQPQRFDASLASSPGDYRKRISQRAVQNISSLGGAGAGAAIERSFLSFFETFGYERIGLSCRLRNGVCAMGGVKPAPRGYVLVEGGGIPALSVIGYNPTVDWDELVARIQAVVANNARPVVR